MNKEMTLEDFQKDFQRFIKGVSQFRNRLVEEQKNPKENYTTKEELRIEIDLLNWVLNSAFEECINPYRQKPK